MRFFGGYRLVNVEMANTLQAIMQDLIASRTPIIMHLFYVYFNRGDNSRNHWEQEIASFIPSVSVRKGTHSFPNKNWIYHTWFGQFEDNWNNFYGRYLGLVTDKKKTLNFPNESNNEEKEKFKTFLITTLKEWSEILSKEGQVRHEQVYETIKQGLGE